VNISTEAARRASRTISTSGLNAITTHLGTSMMHTARFEYERYGHNGYDGFKPELTAGGQNAEVYTHVLGTAELSLWEISLATVLRD
jgi:hypothetical protein